MDRVLAKKYHRMLLKYGAKFLYGYPSVLFLLGKFLAEEGLTLPTLKAVVTTGEMLLPHYRRSIEKTLGCPVFDNLGCNDGGFESYECKEHKGFHYNDLQAILEVEDCLSVGESRLLITNLWNKSTPFIRYENGDLVTLSKVPCACGSPFPKISSIRGRTADILTFQNGRSLSGPALTLIFGEMEIDAWQIVQTGPNRIEVRILCREGLNPKYVAHIRRILSYHLSDDIEVDIKRVEKLELTKAGKWKPIWKEVEEKGAD
ncbi:MAG: hypothetical protein QE160_06460 [Candidatus Verstraetearchaeota archaeon]|nr:hypothetical protein [Candidatus Verstraetearchaeota archaeon]